MAGDMGSLRANRRKAEAAPPGHRDAPIRRMRCRFPAARPWSRLCCPACRLWLIAGLLAIPQTKNWPPLSRAIPGKPSGEAIIGLAAARAAKKTIKLAPFPTRRRKALFELKKTNQNK